MTKPSYEELEFELRYIADSPTEDHGGFHPRVVKAAQDALAELLRVRGLLQRGVEYIKRYGCSDSKCRDAGHVEMKQWLAESADIGKVDASDKSVTKPRHLSTSTDKAESAETGGEKTEPESEIVELSLQAWQYAAYIGEWDAAQAEEWRAGAEVIEIKLHRAVSDLAKLRGLNFKQFPNFCKLYDPHYGQHLCACGLQSTMPMSADDCAREPEKLNNAPVCGKCRVEMFRTCFDDGVHDYPGWWCHCGVYVIDAGILWALAESSLSSPPPKSDLSAPCSPAPLSTQPDTHTEKI